MRLNKQSLCLWFVATAALQPSKANADCAQSGTFAIDNRGITVTPATRAIAQGAGITSFVVSNRDTGLIPWTAAVTLGSPWLRITSGASGVNGGIIFLAYDANPDPGPRSGTIRVSAPSATPPFVDVSVVQSGTAPPPQVTHFEFAPITGPYMVGDPIPVTITAINASNTAAPQIQTLFNGLVNLSTNAPCPLWPNTITLTDGIGTGAVNCDQGFAGTVINARSGGLHAQSTAFAILPPPGATGTVSGSILGPLHLVLPGLTITVTGDDGVVRDAAVTVRDSNPPGLLSASYRLGGLPPASYTVHGVGGQWRTLRKKVFVRAGATEFNKLELFDSNKPPVLLVGGIMGSTLASNSRNYPKMPGEECPDRSLLILHDPTVCVGGIIPNSAYAYNPTWGKLKDTLESNFTVIEVPWDWRKSITDRPCKDDNGVAIGLVEKYLIPAIDEAKGLRDKVHVVSHSLGGILVRDYVQGPNYRNDIDRLAMCGPPNRGAALPYYVWEGGDTETPDRLQDSGQRWSDRSFCSPNDFYTETLKNIYGGIPNKKNKKFAFLTNNEKMEFIQESMRGVYDLMPTFRFLARGNRLDFLSGYQNSLLLRLENGPTLDRLTGSQTDVARVRTKVFLAQSELTVLQIPVGTAGSGGLYPDGTPTRDPDLTRGDIGIGDGTVLSIPARASLLNRLGASAFDLSKPSSHARLMHQYAGDICAFLRGQPCATVEVIAEAGDPIPQDRLSIYLQGRTQPYLVDPNQNATGIQPATGEAQQYIPDSSLSVAHDSAGILLRNPVEGDYVLEFTTVAGDVVFVDLEYVGAGGQESTKFQVVCHDEPCSIGFVFQRAVAPVVTFNPMIGPPTNLVSFRADDLTRIEWQPVVGAVEYDVYGRPDDQPKYTLLGSTTATTFDTAHPWNAGGSGQAWQYFVTAVAADGKESFFTETVENRHPLIARFAADVTTGLEPLTVTFADQSSGEVSAWAWDFDSDGTIDSTAQNPAHLYETPGGYTVTLTVGGPEGTDTTIRAGFITVDPLIPPNPPMPGDFDGDGDVDLLDLKAFLERMNGPFVDPTIAGWHLFDLDPDYDVDLRDLAEFQTLFAPPVP